MAPKVYCGSGKKIEFDNGGSIINVMLDMDDLAAAFKEYGFKTKDGRAKIKISVCGRKEPDEWGNTHYCTVDTWKPDGGGSHAGNTGAAEQTFGAPGGTAPPGADEIPF